LSTSSSRPRAAGPSIRGYAYQFDKTTLAILDLDDGGEVVVEGIEDVDVLGPGGAQAIQCKYHAGSRFSLPAIRKPLLAMLKGYASGKIWKFQLYAHFPDHENVPATLTVPELKQALTEKKRDGTIICHHSHYKAAILQGFVDHLRIKAGPKFNDQQDQVRDALATALSCSNEDVADLHYGNSVALIMDVAMRTDEDSRRVTREAFLVALDKRLTMYTRWHRELLGRERYLKAVGKKIKDLGLTRSTARRTVVLGAAELAATTEATSVVDLIEALWRVGYGPGYLHTAKPWTVVLDADPDIVADIKRDLIDRQITIHDGYEHLSFSPHAFDRPPMVSRKGGKVIEVSYEIRMISLQTFVAHSGTLTDPTVLLAFHNHSPDLDLDGATPRRLDVAGAGLEEIGLLLGAFS
jgi:hypothetical protein